MKIRSSKLLHPFSKHLTYTFTTQSDGNLAFHVNDNPLRVEVNHTQLCKKLNYQKNALIHMQQIHSAKVHIVQDTDTFHNPHKCDALVTNKKNTPLMVMVADCSPLLFFDPVENVIAVAHAGRQGAFKNIVKNTIQTMQNTYNTEASNILVSIGASIGVCCYKVGEEIYAEALELGLDYSLEKKENRYHLNISSIIEKQLLEAKIKKENIEISKECTSCKSKVYFSYRAKNNTGRFAGVIMLK